MDVNRICTAIVVVSLASASFAGIVVDGRLGAAEGYSAIATMGFVADDGTAFADLAELWVHEDAATGDVFFGLKFSKTLVDNTYGETAVGWGHDSPSGRGHSFGDLIESDKTQFRFTDAAGQVVLDLEFDYMSALGGGEYGTEGTEGADGALFVGTEGSLLEYATSLDYNFNQLGYELTVNSPATNTEYVENPLYPDWQFDVVYEGRVDGNAFANGFGAVTVPVAHISPNKLARKGRFTPSDDPPAPPPPAPPPPTPPVVPEPATAALLLGGTAALLARWRRRSK